MSIEISQHIELKNTKNQKVINRKDGIMLKIPLVFLLFIKYAMFGVILTN